MQHLLSKEAGEQHWHSLAPSAATRVITVETQTASNPATHDAQVRSSHGKPNGYHHPFSMQEATEQVAYPLHPAILLPE
jgi:hypothetical protein